MNLYDPVRGKARRKELGLSVPQIAALCGVSSMAIYKYEAGDLRPSFLTFIKLAHNLRISVASLVEQAERRCQVADAEGWNVLVKAIYAAEALRHREQGTGRILMTKADARAAAETDRAGIRPRAAMSL
ncbi:helix-turn-helix transcriptional regulator [Streptomyces varsoviensis]|uniref:helix-turn-helix domain-containing protein n=1 Tax=Streptomyces varsoviensis TaxID=67373 RepID=UPI0033EC54C0